MRRERHAAAGSRWSGQGDVAARRRPDRCQCFVGDISQRRQGVFLDQCRCRRGPRLGKRSGRSRSGRARYSGRHRRPDRAHRRTQAWFSGAAASARAGRAACLIASAAARSSVADVEAVGKSTTALNLALGLRDLGLRVGLLDADIYGPSVPRLTGIREKPQLNADKKMIPIARFGLAIMSIGFLVEEDTAMIWRGPMVMSAITQMLRDVAWGTLDILVVDMPPGTGDAQLTLAQNVPLKGAIIISTPQDLSLIDARRGLAMFKKVNVPVLGIVENMSYFQCPQCGTRSDIFGHGGARHEAERLAVPFLGEIPLHMSIRATSDSGTPVVESEPDGAHAAIYRAIGAKVRDQLQGVIAAA